MLGAGVMGRGIATLAIGRGIAVSLVDVDETALSAARATIATELRLARLLGGVPRVGPVGELDTTTSVAAVGEADVVVEAISEDVHSKVAAHVAVCAVVRPGTLRVTNTSSIPIAEMAVTVPDPEHLVGVHFMNPPYAIRTVEVVRGPATGDAAMAAVHDLLAALDREPVVVGDGPGFVTSRILHRMINDAVRVVEEGRATAEAVDTLMESAAALARRRRRPRRRASGGRLRPHRTQPDDGGGVPVRRAGRGGVPVPGGPATGERGAAAAPGARETALARNDAARGAPPVPENPGRLTRF